MTIDWAALGIVAVVAIAATLVFTVLLAAGIRLVSRATVETNQAQRSGAVRGAGAGRTLGSRPPARTCASQKQHSPGPWSTRASGARWRRRRDLNPRWALRPKPA